MHLKTKELFFSIMLYVDDDIRWAGLQTLIYKQMYINVHTKSRAKTVEEKENTLFVS